MKEFFIAIIAEITETRDKAIAFIFGDAFTTILSLLFMDGIDLIHPLIKVVMIVVGGFLGGFFGLLGKDVYEYAKAKVKK